MSGYKKRTIDRIYGIPVLEDDGTLFMDINPKLCVWEHLDAHAVEFDSTAGGGSLQLSEIPTFIGFLQKVLERSKTRTLRQPGEEM